MRKLAPFDEQLFSEEGFLKGFGEEILPTLGWREGRSLNSFREVTWERRNGKWPTEGGQIQSSSSPM